MDKSAMYAAGVLLSLMALIAFIRLAMGWTLVVNDISVPLWATGILFVILASMAWWLFASARK